MWLIETHQIEKHKTNAIRFILREQFHPDVEWFKSAVIPSSRIENNIQAFLRLRNASGTFRFYTVFTLTWNWKCFNVSGKWHLQLLHDSEWNTLRIRECKRYCVFPWWKCLRPVLITCSLTQRVVIRFGDHMKVENMVLIDIVARLQVPSEAIM